MIEHRLGIDHAIFFFTLLALVFGLFFSIMVPIGYTNDEGVHVLKAGAISNGNLISEKLGSSSTSEGIPVNTYGSQSLKDIANLEHAAEAIKNRMECPVKDICPQPDENQKAAIYRLSAQPINPANVFFVDLMGANMYPPIPYIPSALAIKTASTLSLSAGATVILARIASLCMFIAICAWSLYLLRQSPARWVVFCVALMPASLMAAASVGIDSLLNALALLFFAIVLRSFLQPPISRFLICVLIVCAALLPLLKLPYAIFSLAIVFLPIYPVTKKGLWIRLTLPLIVLLPALYWTYLMTDANTTQSLWVHAGSTPPNAHDQLLFIITHPFDYLTSLVTSPLVNDWIGDLGLLTHQGNVQLPTLLLFGGLTLVLIASIITSRTMLNIPSRLRKTFQYLTMGVPALAALGIITALYMAFNPVGASIIEGVQGRYFIPLLPFISMALIFILPFKLELQPRQSIFFAGCNTIILLLTCLWYYVIVL